MMVIKLNDNGIVKTFRCKGIELAEEKDAPDFLIITFKNGNKLIFGKNVRILAVSV